MFFSPPFPVVLFAPSRKKDGGGLSRVLRKIWRAPRPGASEAGESHGLAGGNDAQAEFPLWSSCSWPLVLGPCPSDGCNR